MELSISSVICYSLIKVRGGFVEQGGQDNSLKCTLTDIIVKKRDKSQNVFFSRYPQFSMS